MDEIDEEDEQELTTNHQGRFLSCSSHGYRGRGRGRGQYGGRGGGRDNGWRNGDRGCEFGRERSSSDTPNWGNSQPMKAPSHVMKIRLPLVTPRRIKNCLEVFLFGLSAGKLHSR